MAVKKYYDSDFKRKMPCPKTQKIIYFEGEHNNGSEEVL